MFVPPLMLAGVESLKTRFIVGAATLLQLIYMTEVGVIILDSDVPINFKDLAIIFLERTILALLLVTGLSTILMSFWAEVYQKYGIRATIISKEYINYDRREVQ